MSFIYGYVKKFVNKVKLVNLEDMIREFCSIFKFMFNMVINRDKRECKLYKI